MSPRSDTRRRARAKGRTVPRAGAARGVLLALVTAGALLAALATAAAAQPDLSLSVTSLDLSAFPKVSAVVQLGGPAAARSKELTTGDFRVAVDGQAVRDPAVTTGRVDPVPGAIALLIDESGSMRGQAITSAADAARSFIDAMRPIDLVAVHAFNEQFRVLHDFAAPGPALKQGLDGLKPTKETSLYDALDSSLRALVATKSVGSRSLVLLSDGGDTTSRTTLDQALAQVRASGAQVYAVGLKTEEFDATPLQRLAEATGGRYLETPDPAALTSLYQSLAREIHNQYVLTFTLDAASRGRGAGTVVVGATVAGMTAEGSKGFFFPSAPTESTPATVAPEAQPVTLSGAATVQAPGWLSEFLGWSGSDAVVALLFGLLIFVAAYLVSGFLFRRPTVLERYGDVLESRQKLGPKPIEGEETHGAAERAAGRMLAFRGYGEALQQRIEDAGWKLRTSEFVLIHLSAVVVVIMVMAFVPLSNAIRVLVVCAAVIAPLMFLETKARRRREAFEARVPDTLLILANSLRAGQGFEQAMKTVADEGPEPIATEFNRLLAQQRLGVSPEDTLRALADRMQSEAFDWVVMATVIQRQVGGNLAEIYESIAATIRGRERLKQEVKTLTAEGRLSAVVLIALPFFVAATIYFVNRPYAALLYETTAGQVMVSVGLVLMVIGIFWLRRIIRFDI